MKVVGLFAIIFTMFLAGCNTIQGVGEDVQRGGEIIEDAAS